MSKLTLHCTDWRPLHRNTLRGFAVVELGAASLAALDLRLVGRFPNAFAEEPVA